VAFAAEVGQPGKTLNSTDTKIRLRPAQPSDTPVVKEFLRTIWDGEDYVPEVWDDWMGSESGLLVVAEYENQPSGLGRLRDLGWGEWWMEGLRVDPARQGLGIASHLHEFLLERWLETGGSVVRLGTHARRKAVHHLCERTGFQCIARLGDVSAEVQHAGHGFSLAAQNPPALNFHPDQLNLVSARGEDLMDLDWAWACLRRERIGERFHSSLWNWREEGAWAVVHPVQHEPEGRLLVQAFRVDADHCLPFFSDLRRLAFELGCKGVRLFAPFDLAQEAFWERAGWTRDPDEELVLYERRR
jgi:GNAT superfamily N-acetyltransferase